MKRFWITIVSCNVCLVTMWSMAQTTHADFVDLKADDMHAKAIEFLREKHIVSGYPDGTFKPEANVNRAELLKILIRGLGIGEPDTKKYHDCFSDIQDQWFASYVCFAKERNWIRGYNDGTFRPAQTVNNAEALKMLIEVSGIEILPSSNGEWYEPYIATARKSGLFDDSINPTHSMNRGSMSETLFRVIMKRSLNAKKYDATMLTKVDAAKENYDKTVSELQLRIRELETRLDSVETELKDANGKLLSVTSKSGVTTFTAPVYEVSNGSLSIPVTTTVAGLRQEVRFENNTGSKTVLTTNDGVMVVIPDNTQMYLPPDASTSFQVVRLANNFPTPPEGVTFQAVAKVGFDSLSHVQVPEGIRISLPGFHKRAYRTSGTDGWSIDDGPCDKSVEPPRLAVDQKMCVYHISSNDTQILTRELSIFAGGNDPERFTVDPQGNYEDTETGLVWYATDLNYQTWNTDDTASVSSITCAGEGFRLPTALELYSVLSSDPKPGTKIYSLLPGLKEGSYWTSTIFKPYDEEEINDHMINYSKSVWVIDVTSGLKHTNKKSMILPARCVFDNGQIYVPANPQYSDVNGGIRDNQTDLLWYSIDSTPSKWYQSEAVCDALPGGVWRLPTRLELETLIRPTAALPHSDLANLDNNSLDDWYWSSTLTVGSNNQKAWGINLYTGIVESIPISETFKIRCVHE